MDNTISSLVPVTQGNIGNEPVQTVNARSLYAWLESKQKFSDWIKDRIGQYGFTQDVDFTTIRNSMTRPQTPRFAAIKQKQ